MPPIPTDISVTNMMMIGSALAVAVAVYLLVRHLYPEQLLADVKKQADEARVQEEEALARGYVPPPPPGKVKALGGAFISKIGNYLERLVKPKWRDKMGRKFTAMGRPEFRAQDFLAHQILWSLFFFFFGLMLLNFINRPMWAAVPFGVFGWLFPHIWISDQIKKRHRSIARALPYNIDLLTLSVEAGLDFQAALGTVVEKGMPGPLLEEFNIVLSEIRLGKTRAESLRNMADRIQMTEMSAFVSNLVQADKMGTSLGKVLRIQSTQMRIARTHRAEKLANEAPLKMLAPLIGCIFPTVFAVLFGPIVYRLMYGG